MVSGLKNIETRSWAATASSRAIEDIVRNVHRTPRKWYPGVQSHVAEHFYDLVLRQPDVQRAPDVAPQGPSRPSAARHVMVQMQRLVRSSPGRVQVAPQ